MKSEPPHDGSRGGRQIRSGGSSGVNSYREEDAPASGNRYFDDRLGAWVTVCPPGEAFGADDLSKWGYRRALGLLGPDSWKGRRAAKLWRYRKPGQA